MTTTHKAQTNRHRKLLQITITKYDTTPSGLFHQLQASQGDPPDSAASVKSPRPTATLLPSFRPGYQQRGENSTRWWAGRTRPAGGEEDRGACLAGRQVSKGKQQQPQRLGSSGCCHQKRAGTRVGRAVIFPRVTPASQHHLPPPPLPYYPSDPSGTQLPGGWADRAFWKEVGRVDLVARGTHMHTDTRRAEAEGCVGRTERDIVCSFSSIREFSSIDKPAITR